MNIYIYIINHERVLDQLCLYLDLSQKGYVDIFQPPFIKAQSPRAYDDTQTHGACIDGRLDGGPALRDTQPFKLRTI